jgi:nucleoside-diphosphate-sugar epimerase
LAGLSNDPLGELDPALTLEINHGATVRLARLCKEAGVSRFVFSSSCSVYGAQGSELVREGAECRPMTAYANSKLMAERALAGLVDSSWSLTVLRSATAYGLSPRLRTDLVLNNLVGWACATGQVWLKSDGKAWRPLVHVEDMAQAFLAVVEAPREAVHNQTFNVGSTAQNFRVRDLARMVSEVVPGSGIAYAEDSFHDRRSYRVDFGKLAQAPLGYHPRWCARTGADQLWHAFETQGLSVDDLEGMQYHRTRHIEQMLASRQLDASLRRRA